MLSNEIIKVLGDLGERFGIMIDWTQENALPKLQELAVKLVSYKLVLAWVYTVLAILFLIFIVAYWVIVVKKWVDIYRLDLEFGIVFTGIMATVIAAAVIPIALMRNISVIVACNIFPEKIVLDYITQMLK